MADLFVYGALRDREVQRRLLGQQAGKIISTPALLPGYRAVRFRTMSCPTLSKDRNAAVEGLILGGISDDGMRRFGHIAKAVGYRIISVTVSTGRGDRASTCFICDETARQDAEAWDFTLWQGRQKPQFLAMCRKLMATYDPVPAGGLRSAFGRKDVRSHGPDRPYRGFFAIEEYRLAHLRFDGGWTPELLRAVFVSADASVVLPYDPGRDVVLLVEQFRPGPYARGDANPWCLEVVAGRRDKGETPEAAARREAQEEAGLALGRVERIGEYYSSPGAATEYLTGFIGEADLGGGGGFHGLQSEDEDIRTIVVSRARAMASVASGEINNAHTILPLLYLELHHQRLQQLWSGPSTGPG